MPSRIQGITVEIGGDTTGLSKALSGVNKEIRSTQSQLKDVERLLKMDPGNTELLRQKYELLNNSIESTEEKLDALREAEKQVQAQFARGEATEAQYNGLQREIIATEQALNRLQGEAKDTQNRIDNIDEDPIEDVEKAADDAGDALEDAGKDASTFGDMLKAGAIVEGVSSIIDSMSQLSEETKEYQRIMGSLEVSSQKAGYSADETAQVYRTLYGVLGDDQTAATTTANLQALGLSQEELVTLTNAAIGAWATYGDSIPIDSLAESVNETIQAGQVTGAFADVLNWAGTNEDEFNERLAAASDETERQNIVMQELANQGLVQAGEAWQKNNESLVESNQAAADFQDTMSQMAERIQPVLTAVQDGINLLLQSLLDMTEGVDFSGISDGLSDAFSFVAENVFPIIQQAFQWIIDNGQLVSTVLVGIGTAIAAWKIGSIISTVVSGFTTFFNTIKAGQGIMLAFNAIMSANPIMLIVSAVAALVAGFIYLWNTCDGFREFWINLWETLKNAFTVAWEAIVTFFTVTIPEAFNSAITSVSEFIIGVGEWFAQLPGLIWTWLSDAISKIGEWAANIASQAAAAASNFLSNVVNFFSQLPGNIWNFLSSAISNIANWASNIISQAAEAASNFLSNVVEFFSQLPGKVLEFLTNVISNVTTWVANMGSKALEAGRSFFNNLVNTVSQIPARMLSIGADIVSGIWSGISGAAGWLWNQISGFCSNIVNSIKNFFGIGSPSKLMAKEVGKWIPPGITVGIDDAMPQAVRNIDAEMGAIAAVNPFANTQTTTTTTNNNSQAYTFGPGSIVINAQGMDVNTLYQQLTVRMQQEVRRKEVAYGHA